MKQIVKVLLLLFILTADSCNHENMAPGKGSVAFTTSMVVRADSGGRAVGSAATSVFLSIEDSSGKSIVTSKKKIRSAPAGTGLYLGRS